MQGRPLNVRWTVESTETTVVNQVPSGYTGGWNKRKPFKPGAIPVCFVKFIILTTGF